MSTSRLITFAVSVLLLAACQHQPGTRNIGETDSVPSFEGVSLNRSACFGRCPVYTVAIGELGDVRFHGVRYVAQTGKYTGDAKQAELQKLWRMLEASQFMQMSDYLPGKPGCGTVATDMATLVISARKNGAVHAVRYYRGCTDAPAVLDEIAAQIDRAANSAQWVENAESVSR